MKRIQKAYWRLLHARGIQHAADHGDRKINDEDLAAACGEWCEALTELARRRATTSDAVLYKVAALDMVARSLDAEETVHLWLPLARSLADDLLRMPARARV